MNQSTNNKRQPSRDGHDWISLVIKRQCLTAETGDRHTLRCGARPVEMNRLCGSYSKQTTTIESLPTEIKELITDYLPIRSLTRFKLCSKAMNFNYHHSQAQLQELYHSQKLFNNATAFKNYLNFNQPTRWDLEMAIKNNNADIVQTLIEDKRVDPSAEDNHAIRCACSDGLTEIVKILLKDERVNPSALDNAAFICACLIGHTEIVKMMLKDKRVNPSANENMAIRVASYGAQTNIVHLLLKDQRVDPSADHNYVIRRAFDHGHIDTVKMLLKDERVDFSSMDGYSMGWGYRNHIPQKLYRSHDIDFVTYSTDVLVNTNNNSNQNVQNKRRTPRIPHEISIQSQIQLLNEMQYFNTQEAFPSNQNDQIQMIDLLSIQDFDITQNQYLCTSNNVGYCSSLTDYDYFNQKL
ncbi:hypothetical protein HDV02_003945 [Globomyces sp. JEL0801]|nr:hypothetical protein HDV02_003945 [Globomyces sp. JEL0801]